VLGRNYGERESRFDSPLMGCLDLRFGGNPLGRWSVAVPRGTRQWGIVVSAFYRMGGTGRAAATGYVRTATWCRSVSGSTSLLSTRLTAG
jgi:hypothetical protein